MVKTQIPSWQPNQMRYCRLGDYCWRLDRASQRTILWFDFPCGNGIVRKPKRTYRNPIILAQEMALTMEYEELSKADLARRLGCSRARVTQLLNLLDLPKDLLLEIRSMGDHWDRQRVTERQLRSARRAKGRDRP